MNENKSQVGCNDVAIKKARTAALFRLDFALSQQPTTVSRKESAELGKKTQPGQPVSKTFIPFAKIQKLQNKFRSS